MAEFLLRQAVVPASLSPKTRIVGQSAQTRIAERNRILLRC